jgi:hypothetical protein
MRTATSPRLAINTLVNMALRRARRHHLEHLAGDVGGASLHRKPTASATSSGTGPSQGIRPESLAPFRAERCRKAGIDKSRCDGIDGNTARGVFLAVRVRPNIPCGVVSLPGVAITPTMELMFTMRPPRWRHHA